MKKRFFILFSFSILLLSPNLIMADCLDLGRATDYSVQDNHTIIYYSGVMPLAYVTIPYCNVKSSSAIELSKTYTCDSDQIIIDGEACMISTINSHSFPGTWR